MDPAAILTLREHYGDRLQEHVPLAPYTSARIGGLVDALLFARSLDELAEAAVYLWWMGLPFTLLGGGANVLVSDRGVRGVVLLNRAKLVTVNAEGDAPSIHAESGATMNDIGQRAARHNLGGFEWGASIPGSLGGAVYGNAGAFGGEMQDNIQEVEILHRERGREKWSAGEMGFEYRSSILKRERQPVLILAATLKLTHSEPEAIRAKMADFSERRRRTQPPGASMGSMFKNPPGEKAGRLIEAAGLKGRRIGTAEVSSLHGNFFLNTENTRAEDMRALIDLVQKTVLERSGILLEPEIEILGEW